MKLQPTLREYVMSRPDAEKAWWNSEAPPLREIVKHRFYWIMIAHRYIIPACWSVVLAAGIVSIITAAGAGIYSLFKP